MNIIKPEIEGLLILTPRVFGDERGTFMESFNQQKFDEAVGRKVNFVQDNQSISKKGVLRGLHFQSPPFAQGKLVRVIKGAVIDIAVDIRKNSPTYGDYVAVELTAENNEQFWIPEGFAHGFVALKDETTFLYKCTNYYAPQSEGTLLWNDPTLNIDWGISDPIISEKDAIGQEFSNFVSDF
ncbi:MAG: dTDP-4-dehydrorhamnose 3,5-epimerase [Crocinitomicaceae bacterium]